MLSMRGSTVRHPLRSMAPQKTKIIASSVHTWRQTIATSACTTARTLQEMYKYQNTQRKVTHDHSRQPGRNSATIRCIIKILFLDRLDNPVLHIFKADPSKLAFLNATVLHLISDHFDLNGLVEYPQIMPSIHWLVPSSH